MKSVGCKGLNIRVELDEVGIIRRVVDEDNNYIYLHTQN